jgi:hypothetical protein
MAQPWCWTLLLDNGTTATGRVAELLSTSTVHLHAVEGIAGRKKNHYQIAITVKFPSRCETNMTELEMSMNTPAVRL